MQTAWNELLTATSRRPNRQTTTDKRQRTRNRDAVRQDKADVQYTHSPAKNMGLFSRREKAPKPMVDSKPAHILSTSQSKSSLTSGSSSIKSPIGGFSSSRMMNRTSAGTTSTSGGTSTPNTSFSPTTPAMPRIDMPRPPDPQLDPAGYLRSLGAVRERSKVVTEKAYRNQLHHFDVDMAKFDDVVAFVSNIIKVSRWTKGGVQRPPAPAGAALGGP